MYPRHLSENILKALTDTPVILINGARQTGKSTLVMWISEEKHSFRYLTFDDPVILDSVKTDPVAFISSLEGSAVLDEIQRAPELFISLKMSVDQNRQPGKFLLTGSANVLMLPKLSESLAGRMEVHTLWPLSQGEILGVREGFIDALFSSERLELLTEKQVYGSILWQKIFTGGYPEVLARQDTERRTEWFRSYISTLLQRDVRDLSNIEGVTAFPRLLSLLAIRAGGLTNISELSRTLSIPVTTLRRYLNLLEAMFLLRFIPPWSGNLGKRLVKSPKLFLNDTGLLAYLMGINQERIQIDSSLMGGLMENFVVMELTKQAAWSKIRPELYHFRTQSQQEIDIILEAPDGLIVGIEVKARQSVGARDFDKLKMLIETLGNRFHRGIVLYAGREAVPFGPNLWALPVSALWRLNAQKISS